MYAQKTGYRCVLLSVQMLQQVLHASITQREGPGLAQAAPCHLLAVLVSKAEEVLGIAVVMPDLERNRRRIAGAGGLDRERGHRNTVAIGRRRVVSRSLCQC